MTEDEMKTKQCPKHEATRVLVTLLMSIKNVSKEVNFEILDKLNLKGLCSAAECAMWEPWDDYQTRIIGIEEEVPEGWILDGCYQGTKSKRITKTTYTGKGDCGLKTKELECNC